MELADTDLTDILAEYGAGSVARGFDDEDADGARVDDFEFFTDVVSGVVREQRSIDPKINECLAQGWRLERLDSILRAILRAGTYELGHRADVPTAVVINEYLDVAHAFFQGDEPKFVNGVLDRLARQARETETVR
jgi:N utilization substance protein B